MKIGVYGHIGHKGVRAAVAGFEAIGHSAVIRTAKYWNGKTEGFDLVVVAGEHSGLAVAKAYRAADVPVLTLDWGYVKRVNSRGEHGSGYWQVGADGLNSIPPFECPPDRFDALDVDIVEQGGHPDGYVLVCGQVPGDAAHGLGYKGYTEWLHDVLRRYPDAVYRPHPAGVTSVRHPRMSEGPLVEALAGARLVVTYNSNVGHDALLAGVPVVAEGKAAYGELSGEALPSLEDRRAYFNRLAYGQWTVAEMESGEPQRFWLDCLLNGKSEGRTRKGFLREDGPTVAEFVAAGYPAINYPPRGYASRSTEDEIAAAIAAQFDAGGDQQPGGQDRVGSASGEQTAGIDPANQPPSATQLPVNDGLDELDAEQLHVLAKERGVKVHHKAGADKVRAALREAVTNSNGDE